MAMARSVPLPGTPLVQMPDLQKVYDFLTAALNCHDMRFEMAAPAYAPVRFTITMELVKDPSNRVAVVRSILMGGDEFTLPIGDTPWVLHITDRTVDFRPAGIGGGSYSGPVIITITGELLLKRP